MNFNLLDENNCSLSKETLITLYNHVAETYNYAVDNEQINIINIIDDNINKKETEFFNEHYKQHKYEPNKVIEDWIDVNRLSGVEGYIYGQVLRYLSRIGLKNAKQKDLKKATYYLKWLCEKNGVKDE